MMDEELVVCTPSGQGTFSSILFTGCLLVGSGILVYQGFSDHAKWLWLLLTLPAAVLLILATRYDFLGEEHIGVDGDDFVVVYKNNPFRKKPFRIPLSEIKEIGKINKTKFDNILDTISELRGYDVDDRMIILKTIDGKEYNFGHDLSPRDIRYVKERLLEIMIEKMTT